MEIDVKSFLCRCVLVLLTAVFPLAAQADDAQIEVSATGSAAGAPDMAVLTLTVNREAPTAGEAVDASSAAMAQVLNAMRSLGVADRDLQTSGFSIHPNYAHLQRVPGADGQARRFTGYTVRNSLTVRLRDVGRVGEALDAAVRLGVNEGGNIAFANQDPAPLLDKARRRAVKAAMGKARTLADAAGVRLGSILEIAERSRQSQPLPFARAEMAMSDASVPVASGENSYQVTVEMTFAIAE
ncbi:MAG: hypothetical protein CME59_03480 [Halioglobus sp.]|nr:hypothetical protein [Halioglobus sp.]|tara:strand:+ start:399 stop:1121 length:723 start_codon:yes stop_codon:yes gene_type:complete